MLKLCFSLLTLAFLFTECFRSHDKVKIAPIKQIDTILTRTLNGEKITSKIDNYKISNFWFDKINENMVDSFTKKHLSTGFAKYSEYRMEFFEAVDDSDTSMLKHRPDRFYSTENMIYEYIWTYGKLIQINQFDDGKISVRWTGL